MGMLFGMSTYLRVRIAGGTYFFTVNLLERQRRLLVEHIDDLRASFWAAQRARPFDLLAGRVAWPPTNVVPSRRVEQPND
jgi:hypothetical protein